MGLPPEPSFQLLLFSWSQGNGRMSVERLIYLQAWLEPPLSSLMIEIAEKGIFWGIESVLRMLTSEHVIALNRLSQHPEIDSQSAEVPRSVHRK
jgi:hypothetical protein